MMTVPSKLERLNHAHITVPLDRLAEARHFYCEVIGLTEVPKPPELTVYPGFWLQLDGLQLHVGGDERPVDRWASGAHPVLATVTLHELTIERLLVRIDKAAEAARLEISTGAKQQTEAAKTAASHLITRAPNMPTNSFAWRQELLLTKSNPDS